MAGKRILDHKKLRVEAESAERAELQEQDDEGTLGKTEEKGKTKEKKAPAKRKSRAKTVKEVRRKAFWGVFNQTLKRITKFEYSQRAEADKKAAELTESQKTPHFVQLVKEDIEE